MAAVLLAPAGCSHLLVQLPVALQSERAAAQPCPPREH